MKYQVVVIHDRNNVNYGRFYWKDEQGNLRDSVRYLNAPFSYPEGTVMEEIRPGPIEGNNRPPPEPWDNHVMTRVPNGNIVRKNKSRSERNIVE